MSISADGEATDERPLHLVEMDGRWYVDASTFEHEAIALGGPTDHPTGWKWYFNARRVLHERSLEAIESVHARLEAGEFDSADAALEALRAALADVDPKQGWDPSEAPPEGEGEAGEVDDDAGERG